MWGGQNFGKYGFLRPRKGSDNLEKGISLFGRVQRHLKGVLCSLRRVYGQKRGLCLGKGKTWPKMDFIHLEGNFMHRKGSFALEDGLEGQNEGSC